MFFMEGPRPTRSGRLLALGNDGVKFKRMFASLEETQSMKGNNYWVHWTSVIACGSVSMCFAATPADEKR